MFHPKLTIRGRLWTCWKILTVRNPPRFGGESKRDGKTTSYHVVPHELIIRIADRHVIGEPQ